MTAVLERRRAVVFALLVLCVSVVALLAGLLLVQGGATGAGGSPAPSTATSTVAVPAPTGAVPQGTVEEPQGAHTPVSGLPTIGRSDLPPEAHETLDLIRSGGPFPYRQDDETFFNREGILPGQPRGYYREYTVETRGSPDRGARRIVAGDGGDLYYTTDHYDSFEQIEAGR